MNHKVIIATDGNKTLVLRDGELIICESIDFHGEAGACQLTINGEFLNKPRQTEAKFVELLKEVLGYELSHE